MRLAPYVVAIFSSAFLIFLVQPMVGKRILPWFGGVPAVWSVCLAFYQVVLFAGYVYAHFVIRFVSPRLQLWVHAGLLAAAIGSLPVLPQVPPSAGESTADPIRSVLAILASSVLLPFVALASTGPLVQAWFARANPTRSPYPLYAVSNLGSLVALVGYPFVLEPRLQLTDLGRVWGHGLIASGAAILACAVPLAFGSHASRSGPEDRRSDPSERPRLSQGLSWLLLSATAVILLMGVTNKISLDIASIPFLWIVPLAVYLLAFIIAFTSDRAYHRATFLVVTCLLLGLTRMMAYDTPIAYQIAGYCALLFAACMVLHGELHRSRPGPAWLTSFYLVVAAGGAIGGIFVGIVAPVAFDDYYELEGGLILGILTILAIVIRDPGSLISPNRPRWRLAAASAFALALVGAITWRVFLARPLIIHRERSFFGVLSIVRSPAGSEPMLSLMNGSTAHGLQLQDPGSRLLPTTYFGRATGLGLALTSRLTRGQSRIGVVGLGVGTVAAYGREGDSIRFYEIDPGVVRISGPGGYFSYVDESDAQVDVVLGDARRSIEDEQDRGEPQQFDFLVLDAFSSDSIPVHLMTREAFERYFRALAPDGLMAVHVSNRHFELTGLVSRTAKELGADSLEIWTRAIPRHRSAPAKWVIVGRDSDQLTRLSIRIKKRYRGLGLPPSTLSIRRGMGAGVDAAPVWTDDYSDLFSILSGD